MYEQGQASAGNMMGGYDMYHQPQQQQQQQQQKVSKDQFMV